MKKGTRILHLADVHLDRPFVGLPREAAAHRRTDLWQTFCRCLEAAREHRADLVTIGGDLWEDENVTANTRASVAHELGRLGIPALLICGNHDPLLPGGNYPRTDWPPNVRVFDSGELREHRADGVSVWGVSWTGGQLTADFLERFRVPDDGRVHLLLLHGTAHEVAHLAPEGHGYCPFDPRRVLERGFALCLAGHVHAAASRDGLVYPGSPEPLGWGETDRHCYALIDIESGGAIGVELVDVNRRRFEARVVDCSEAGSSAEVAERLVSMLVDEDAENIFLRVELTGEVDPQVRLDTTELAAAHGGPYAALIVIDHTIAAYDLDGLVSQQTARGRYARRLLDRIEQAQDERERKTLELALLAGLRALDGREDVV